MPDYHRSRSRLTHQSCKRTVRSSRYIVFDRKSMPIVACGTAKHPLWHEERVRGACGNGVGQVGRGGGGGVEGGLLT